MSVSRQRYYIFLVLVALLALFLSEALFMFRDKNVNIERHVRQFQDAFANNDAQLQEALAAFMEKFQNDHTDPSSDREYLDRLLDEYGNKDIAFFHYNRGELLFWTDNTIPIDWDVMTDSDHGVLRLQNGWYYYRQQQLDDDRWFAFTIIKYGFKYQNRFLVNKFHRDYCIDESWFFISDKEEEGRNIHTHKGDYAFSLRLQRETGLTEENVLARSASLLLAVLGFVMLMLYLFRCFSVWFNEKNRSLAIAGFVIALTILRYVSFHFSLPSIFYEGKLFSPALYATSMMLPSLGDLFLNVMIYSIISFFLFTHLKQFPFKGPVTYPVRLGLSLLVFAAIYFFCILTVFLIRGLVINSHLILDVNFIFNLDLYSLVGFLIIGCIFFSFFFLSVVLFRLALNLLQKQSHLWLVYFLMLMLFVGLHWIMKGPGILEWLLFMTALIVFMMERKSQSPQAGFTSLLMSLFIFGLISSLALYRFNQEKDLERRKTMALQLASEQDPVAEFLFLEMEETLFNDHQLRNLIMNNPYDDAAIYRYLLHHYFYDFWIKYDFQITVCHTDEELLIRPSNVLVDCIHYFDDYMESFGKPTISDRLIYLDNNTGRNSYIAKIPVNLGDGDDDPPSYFVFLEFDSKYIARDMGFPELLIDDRIDISREIVNYSYAIYKDGVLINKYGSYNYSIDSQAYNYYEGEFADFYFDGFRHLLFRKDAETHIIISRPEQTILERIAPFSYLFILFFVLIVIFYLLTSHKALSELFRLNLKKRVQVSMIAIVIVSVLAIGGASTWFILGISQNKNLSFLSEKAHSVLVETELALDADGIGALDESLTQYLSDMLVRQSNVFFTEINLYDIEGKLLASSRQKLFEEGLISNRMNPKAYFSLRDQQINQYIHNEQIGKLNYLSAYMLLRNHYQELIGYVNLPYFAKQSELRDEMAYFMVAFINIYLMLLVVAILMALFISNFVTRPLLLIRESLSKVQLGRKNQKIDWPRSDEIGSLVNEYNRMIDELEASAELLGKSERESAWREMARQVAHEIKNPLTPMRLNIQYLEKAWKEKMPDWDDRLERFAKTMIEQIDNLSLIAGAFSDFAQMPPGKNNKINLRDFLPEVLNLYNDSENVNIVLVMPQEPGQLWVNADRNQLIRVLNNLVNNGIQAYPKNALATIKVQCIREAEGYRIDIKDYGSGIPETLQTNIFSPNFTTKTSGMGMGLSMVKAIIENHGGRVSFHSAEGQGSVFTFILPVANYTSGSNPPYS